MILVKSKPEPSSEDKDQLIISADEFSMMVEEKALRENISCFTVIMEMIEADEVGIDNVPTLISQRLKSKLETDAKHLNLLKKETTVKKTLI